MQSFLIIRLGSCIFVKNTTEVHALLSTTSRKEMYLIAADNNLDHMGKLVPADFLHCKVTIFHFEMNKRIGGRISWFLLKLSPRDFGIHQQILSIIIIPAVL